MDFALNEQQEMMQSLAREFLTGEYPEKVMKAMAAGENGFTLELWQKMVETDLTGLGIPEEYGGVGDFLDLTVVLEEMGRACYIGPFFSTVVLGASLISEAGSEEQKQEFLTAIASGKIKFTLALCEESGGYTAESIRMKAESDGSGYILNGTKLFVPDAHTSDQIIVAARTDGGITLFIADKNTRGMTCTPVTIISGDKQSEVCFKDVRIPDDKVLGKVDEGRDHLIKALEKTNCARCAEMVGGAQYVLNLTLDYAKERTAFGHPIGAFQAMQHRFADMLTDIDGSRFATYQAAWRINEGLPAAREVAIAKAWVSQACRRVMKSAHQIHGAIGFTEDHILHYYTKKSLANEFSFGDTEHHLEYLASLP